MEECLCGRPVPEWHGKGSVVSKFILITGNWMVVVLVAEWSAIASLLCP